MVYNRINVNETEIYLHVNLQYKNTVEISLHTHMHPFIHTHEYSLTNASIHLHTSMHTF